MRHWHDVGGWTWGGWLVPTVVVTVLLSLFIGGTVAAVLRAGRKSPSGPQRILAERFARGEIDQEEYEQRRAALP